MRPVATRNGVGAAARGGNRGFTLIEMMIVVAIMGIAVTIGWNALFALRRSVAAEQHAMRVTTALESEMDRLRAAPPDALPESGAFVDPELASVPGATARRMLSPLGSDLTRVVLSASWRTPGGRARAAWLVSLLPTGTKR